MLAWPSNKAFVAYNDVFLSWTKEGRVLASWLKWIESSVRVDSESKARQGDDEMAEPQVTFTEPL